MKELQFESKKRVSIVPDNIIIIVLVGTKCITILTKNSNNFVHEFSSYKYKFVAKLFSVHSLNVLGLTKLQFISTKG